MKPRNQSQKMRHKLMKTNKSYTKRLRLTKNGKIIARTPGHNHFKAKDSGAGHMRKRRFKVLEMSATNRSRFLH